MWPLIEMRKEIGKKQLNFESVQMLTGYLSSLVQGAAGYMSLEFRGADGTRDTNLEIVNMQRVFKALGMYEITQSVCADSREDVGGLSPSGH